MRMLETTLLTGPYDWDAALVPRSEFDARIAAVRAILRQRGLNGLVVGGTSPEHGALGYLTGFVPKLGPALEFIPSEGDLRIVFSGGAAMLSSAQRLTFITDVRAMRDSEQEFAAWLRETKGTRFALWGDYAITCDVRRALDRVVAAPLVVLDGELDALRRRKSVCELALIRRACEILDVTVRELRAATMSGKGVRAASLAAERAAYAHGAQDVRMLVSLRDGSMPQPLIGTGDPHVDPLLACVAVRFAGYFAEGLATITAKPTATFAAAGAADAADAALAAMLQTARPNVVASQLTAAARQALAGAKLHPLVAASPGNGIGVSRQEAPFLTDSDSSPLQDGDVCTLRAGAYAGAAGSAIVSATVRVGQNGAEILWK
jgi:Xaa-Pro aminopeptidase